ncbi:MAG: phosphatidylglycerol lysyltransferase domain-containing protein [Pseudomonadota bacterium]
MGDLRANGWWCGAFWARRAGHVALPFAILAVCTWILADRLSAEMIRALPGRLADIALWQWVCAAALTTLSFYSVGRYDVLAHRFLRTRLPERAAGWTGSVAIAVGQTLGFGLVTGALARWRMLPALGARQAFKVSAFVSASFILSWVVVASLACLLLPAPSWAKWLGLIGTAVAYVGLIALFFCPEVRVRKWRIPVPGWRMCAGMVFWALVDTFTAAAALYVMLPAGAISLAALYPIFLIAVGAALVSNTPGGLGPFEVVLLTALPAVGVEAVLTAILAYRLVYYALPAGVAALALMRPFAGAHARPAPVTTVTLAAPRSEVGVVRQNGGGVYELGRSALALWPTGQTLSVVADPVAGAPGAALTDLKQAARQAALIPFAYKSGPRLAATARRAGWSVLRIADDAIVSLPQFDLSVPSRRTLRRKLRHARQAGVELSADCPLPYADLARIDAAWQATHGRARGGSMGRYAADYIAEQWVALAKVDGQSVAFVTAHRARDEWCLDLMRYVDDVPDGTMHALVHSAIEAAQAQGARRFCLAATPACPDPSSALWRWVAQKVVEAAGGPGLRQFKSNFGPTWRPRYATAPGRVSLAVGLADVMRAVHMPRPLSAPTSNSAHDLDENYELASHRAA